MEQASPQNLLLHPVVQLMLLLEAVMRAVSRQAGLSGRAGRIALMQTRNLSTKCSWSRCDANEAEAFGCTMSPSSHQWMQGGGETAIRQYCIQHRATGCNRVHHARETSPYVAFH